MYFFGVVPVSLRKNFPKEDWSAKGNSLEDIKELSLYVNATEGMVYYVVNDDYLSGSFAF